MPIANINGKHHGALENLRKINKKTTLSPNVIAIYRLKIFFLILNRLKQKVKLPQIIKKQPHGYHIIEVLQNFSEIILSPTGIRLMEKGLNFCSATSYPENGSLLSDIFSFSWNRNWKETLIRKM